LGGEGDNPTPPAVAARRAAAGPAVVLADTDVAADEAEEAMESTAVGNKDNDGEGVGAWRVDPERAAPATVGRAKMEAVKAVEPEFAPDKIPEPGICNAPVWFRSFQKHGGMIDRWGP
jgi:hypothetical protein